MLTPKLVTVKQAIEDADKMIVDTTIEESTKTQSVTIVEEDVDLLIVLTALDASNTNIYMLQPGKGNIESIVYTQSSI